MKITFKEGFKFYLGFLLFSIKKVFTFGDLLEQLFHWHRGYPIHAMPYYLKKVVAWSDRKYKLK